MDDFLKGSRDLRILRVIWAPSRSLTAGSPESDTLAIGDSEIGDSITFRFQPLNLGSVFFWHTFVS